MVNWMGWRASVVAAALVAWPLVATAQQSDAGQQATGSTTTTQQQTQGTAQQGTQQTQGTEQQSQTPPPNQGQGGFGQGQGQAADTRQVALSHLTAARQSLADMTKLPAAAHLEGQARNEVNELISSFNALISSTGPEWRQAYDRVQSSLASLLGPENGAPGQPGQGAVGTSGTTPSPSIDPSITAKLNEVRQHVDQFGQTVGVKPGESAVAQGQTEGQPSGGSMQGASGVANEQALRDVDQIGAMIARFLSQPSMSPNQDSVTVSRQDLQQIQQYLNQLRQSLGRGPGQ